MDIVTAIGVASSLLALAQGLPGMARTVRALFKKLSRLLQKKEKMLH